MLLQTTHGEACPDQDDSEIQEFTIAKRGMMIERDARGKIISARVPQPSLNDQLLELGVIDREQHWLAEQFIAMHRVFLRPVATYKTVTAYQSDTKCSPRGSTPSPIATTSSSSGTSATSGSRDL